VPASLQRLIALGAPAIGEAQTGYWQYVKTDTYIDLYANHDRRQPRQAGSRHLCGRRGRADRDTIGTGQQTFRLAGSFAWSRPPAILIPGTALYWPAAATIVQNTGNNPPYLGFGFLPLICTRTQSVSDLTNYYAAFVPLSDRDEPRHRSELRKSRGNRGFL
jgi:hypothetical protein